ncbi:MAG: YicC family protein [Flavobacteriales bacterium]|nr:YicC family protein [Flavobacteriales bacterium]
MKTSSMTGFGKSEARTEDEKVVVEIRALNSKQLDMNLKMPQLLKELEMDMRRIMTDKLTRGKIELSVSLEGGLEKKAVINEHLAAEYHAQLSGLSKDLSIDEEEVDMLSLIMKMPEVLQTQRSELSEELSSTVIKVVEEACIKLTEFRMSEGISLDDDLRKYISSIASLQEEVAPHVDIRVDRIRERIKKNMEQQMEGKEYDPSRFEQEIIYYLEKYDVSEEMTRLKNHCEYFIETLELEGAKGKKLGFIAQEIGREINTLGAKSYDSEMQKLVVRMKDDLEKIKEQCLNVL